MFCPLCGHQQADGSVRFCTRGGMDLDVESGELAALPKELAAARGDDLHGTARIGRAAFRGSPTAPVVPALPEPPSVTEGITRRLEQGPDVGPT